MQDEETATLFDAVDDQLRGVKAGYTSINPLRNIEKMHSSVSYFTTTHVLAKFMIFLSYMIISR